MNDVDKTRALAELVRRRHPSATNMNPTDLAGRWLVVEEVPTSTGGIVRSADLVAVAMWPGDGLRIVGYELKVSRSDLKRELAEPSKAIETAAWCDEWWLAVWDGKMLEGLDIPAEWGIVRRMENGGECSLRTERKPAAREIPATIKRGAMVTLLRAAARASAGAWHLSEAVRDASARSYANGQRQGASEVERRIQEALAPAIKHLMPTEPWRRPALDTVCERIVQFVNERAVCGKEGA